MAEANPVSKMFGRHLRTWQEALARWIQNCKGVQEERRTLHMTGGLVAEETRRPRHDLNPVLSDAAPPSTSSGLSAPAEERLRQLDSRAARCGKTIREIQTIIAQLQQARKTGVWRNSYQLSTAFHKQPKFIAERLGRISRGEDITVLEVKGDWWRVRAESGAEGWVHQGQVLPHLPVELSATPGRPHAQERMEWSAGRG
jgi:hypothetical protein